MAKRSSKVNTLVVGADLVDVDQRDEKLVFEGTHDTNASLHLVDVDKAVVDQSGSTTHVKGGKGEVTFLNRFEDCGNVEVNQNETFSITEPSENSKHTAVNYVRGVDGYKQTMHDSTIIIDSRNRRKRPGVTAHTIIDGGTNATIVMKNTNIVIKR